MNPTLLYVITRADTIGGAQVHVKHMARAVRERGWKAIVATGGSGPFHQELADLRIPSIRLQHLTRTISVPREVRAILELRRTVVREQPDLVALHSTNAGIVGRLACRGSRLPVVFTADGWSFPVGAPLPRRVAGIAMERWLAPFAERIITVCEADRELALRHRITGGEKLVTVHNGVPNLGIEHRATPDHDPPTLVMVGRFESPKVPSLLLLALNDLRDQRWHLQFIGDGPLLAATRALASELDLDSRVTFLGARSNIAELMARAQVFCLATEWEGFPLTILEAMRAGLPVIASDVGGIREAVHHGTTGFLVERGDRRQLAGTLRTLIGSPDQRRRLGEAGRRLFETKFTLGEMVEKTVDIYEQAMESHGMT